MTASLWSFNTPPKGGWRLDRVFWGRVGVTKEGCSVAARKSPRIPADESSS